jgi:hypothetical protein
VERRGDLPQRLDELLVIVDQAARRTALDADVVPVAPTPGGDTFTFTATAVSRGRPASPGKGASGDHAALHAWLRQWVYQDQTFHDLARPPLWGALAVLAEALVPVISDQIARGLSRVTPAIAFRSRHRPALGLGNAGN